MHTFKSFFLLITIIFISNLSQAATKYELTVAKDGSGDYTSIQSALNDTKAFPDKPITIRVKNGVYNEKVTLYSWNDNLRIIGESKEKTIVTFGDYFKSINLGRNSTFHTYTLKVEANNVTIENLSIINSAGKVGQAVALHLEGNNIEIKNCKIIGNQDTVYADGEGCFQSFKNCHIEGTTDFIFGQATAVFSACTIHSKSNSYITAASTKENQKLGFVFINCKLTAAHDVDMCYLGRPWRDYAKTVFINCSMDKHIAPVGWSNWGGTQRDKTAYYAEYKSYGEGASSQTRANWSHQLSKKEYNKIMKLLSAYQIEN